MLNKNDSNWREKLSSTSTTLTYSSGSHSSVALEPTPGGFSAMQFLTALAADLSKGPVELPCFPNIVIKIRDALNDPTTTPASAVKLVGSEPRLAARLIQTANSAAFNTTGRPITELRAAMTRLGHQLVQGTAVAYALQQVKNEKTLRPIAQSLTELWKNSIAVASLCQVISRRTKVAPDEAFLSGLLHGIGLLYIITHAASNRVDIDGESASELIHSWQASIGKTVLENWAMPITVSEAVGEQDVYDRKIRTDGDLCDVLIVSKLLAHSIHDSSTPLFNLSEVNSCRSLQIDQQGCNDAIVHARYQVESLQDALGC